MRFKESFLSRSTTGVRNVKGDVEPKKDVYTFS